MSNTFQLLNGSVSILEALHTALENCHKTLYVQFSTFEGDSSGQAFAHMLMEKAAQGVDVRLMVDCYSDVVVSDIYPTLIHKRHTVAAEIARTHALFDELRSKGIPVKRTAPPGFMGRYLLYRDHKKMVVLDDEVAFVGGINVSDHNYAWHDFMVKISGELVKNLKTDYCSTWEGSTITLNTPRPSGDFVLNQCAGRYSIFEEILRMIESAQHKLVIESPYLMGDHIETAILDAARRGVKVTLIIPFHSNKLVYRLWVRKMYQRLTHPGITIYGYRGDHDMTHAKLVIVDDRRATFGSLNMFELEGLTQKELNIFTDNADFIQQVQEFISQDIASSQIIPQPPKHTFGHFSYTLLYYFFKWWTNRLIQNPEWTAVYC